jgi:hypothetical protein
MCTEIPRVVKPVAADIFIARCLDMTVIVSCVLMVSAYRLCGVCKMYVLDKNLSDIYLQSQLRVFYCCFITSYHYMFRPLRASSGEYNT